MSRSTNRNVRKKLVKEQLPKSKIPLPNEELKKKKSIKVDSKNKLTNDLLHDHFVAQFILEEDVLNLFPSSGNSSRTESQSSFTDDLEERSTKQISAEYELVERILYGEEKYKNYNQEFDQWTDNFNYLRITGNGVKIPRSWKKSRGTYYEQEVLAEHRDPIDILSPEAAFYKGIKTIINEIVIENILENVNKSKKKNNQRQRWKKRDNTPNRRKNSRERISLLPVSTKLHTSSKQHPIIRSDISSAKWQKAKDDTFDFPVITPDGSRSTSKGRKFSSPKVKNINEDKVFSLPPINGLAFKPDQENKGFFLRSNSCNTHSKQPVKKKCTFRTSSSKVDS